MANDEEDFFGLKTITSDPFPTYFQTNQIKRVSTEQKENLFETEFFSGLAESKQNEEISGDGGSFFDSQFFTGAKPAEYIKDETPIKINDTFELEVKQREGIKELCSLIDPVWKFKREELVDYMAERVIFESDDIIAFDKPFQMAYAAGPSDQAQFDRILQMLKNKIAPNIDRLFLINALEKNCSGVVIFAKSLAKQREMKKLLEEDHFLFRYRCLCKNIPSEEKARISIPMIKVLRGSNFKLCPLIGEASEEKLLYHLSTDYKLVNENRSAHLCLIDAFDRRGLPQLIRSHLYYGINCPIVGDKKYIKSHLKKDNPLPMAISPKAMESLNLRKNDIRKMPMFMHRAEVHVPQGKSGRFSLIRAEMPAFFVHALKRLHLISK